MKLGLADLQRLLELPATGVANPISEPVIVGVNTLALASASDLCFAEHRGQLEAVRDSAAGAVIVPLDFPELPDRCLFPVTEPRRAFFQLATQFMPGPDHQGIHPSAVIDPTATLGEGVSVGPCSVISTGVTLGNGAQVGAGCYLGPGVQLGPGSVLAPNVTIHRTTQLGARCVVHSGTVIGDDGFGFTWDGQAHRKIPQLGQVVIEDDVDIGCNCCIDRATLGETRIRQGTKIDNLVQVGHNTDIGAHVIFVSQSGIAGSSRVGTGAVIAGQVAISDHVQVGAGARVGGQSGVTKDVAPGATVFGTPARAMKESLRELAALAQLPTLLKAFKSHRQDLEALQARLDRLELVQAQTSDAQTSD